MPFKIALLLLALFSVTVSSMRPMSDDEIVPDLDAESQFYYSYGYGNPSYAYAAPLGPTYHVPVVVPTDGVPASTAKLAAQPVAYVHPGYAFASYPYPGGFGYGYGYPYTA